MSIQIVSLISKEASLIVDEEPRTLNPGMHCGYLESIVWRSGKAGLERMHLEVGSIAQMRNTARLYS